MSKVNKNSLYEIFEKIESLKEKGNRLIGLHVVEPDQSPPGLVIEAIKSAILKGEVKYTSAAGNLNLRKIIARKNKVGIDSVIIGPGSKFLIYAFLKTIILKEDDEIIIPTPVWGTYASMVKNIGLGRVRFLKTDFNNNWQIDLEKLKKLINKKTKLIILCDPNNPTGVTIRKDIKEVILNLACRKNIKLIIDNAYKELVFKKEEDGFYKNFKNIVQIFSFSKTYAMTGFRLGYGIADQELIKEIVNFNQITITCVPDFIQNAGAVVLNEQRNFPQKLGKIYQKRAKLAERILRKGKISFISSESGFCIFPKIAGKNAEDFCLRLLDKGVAVIPGTAFGPFPEFLRISLTVQEKQLIKGLNLIVDEYISC